MNEDARLQVFKRFTQDLATLSKCSERQVAAIITDAQLSQVYSIGVNGGPKGLVDCMCKIDGKYGCVHAEINALVKCNSADADKVMFVTLSPCKQCAAACPNWTCGRDCYFLMNPPRIHNTRCFFQQDLVANALLAIF